MPLVKLFLVLFGNNWKAIMLSVLAATTFWFFNALNKNYSTRLNYPIEFSFSRDSVVVVDRLPNKVLVDVSGGGWNLMRKTFLFSADPVLIELDNPTEIKFLTRASLLPLITERLSGLTLDFLATDTVFINIEPKIFKKLSIKVDSLAVPLQEGYRMISEININPDTVEVEGPKSMIDTLTSAYDIVFGRRTIDSDFDDDFDIDFESNLLRPIPDEVQVSFDVARFNQLVMSIPLEKTNFPQDSSIYLEDSVVRIHFTVRARDANRVNSNDFNVTVDLTMMNDADSIVIPVLAAFPGYATELDLEPDSLKVVYAK